MRSRREFLDDFLAHVNDAGDSTARNLAETTLNRAYLAIWMANAWRDHRLPDPVQVTTVANQRTYALPAYFGRVMPQVRELRNLTTGGRLSLRNQEALEQDYPEMGSTRETAGVPRAAFIGSPVGVRVQPAAAGEALEVVSSDVADVDIRVLVEGINSAGEWDDTQVTLNGTAPVALGTWKPPLLTFSKSYPNTATPVTELTSSRGTVTLRTVAGASTLQVLLPEESARQFPSLTVYPKPDTAGQVIAIPTIRAPKRLLYDADEIPRYWDEALFEEMIALWREHAGEAGSAAALPRPHLLKLIAFDNTSNSPDPVRRVPFGQRGGGRVGA